MNNVSYFKRSKHSLVGEIIRLKKELYKTKPQPPADVFDVAMAIVQKKYPYFDFITMCSKSRKTEITIPRQVWQHLIYRFTNTPVKEIGIKSNRDHSCIFNSTYSVENRGFTDRNFKFSLMEMEVEFKTYLAANGVPEKSNYYDQDED